MSETVEPDQIPGYRRFDCTDPEGEQLTAGADAARHAIEQGDCIVLPTDTVYGIGADAFSPAAVQKLLDAKHRGRDMPPPVLMGDASLIRALATDVPDGAKELIARHWPGPLTVICKIQPSLRMDLGDTDGTIALRVPDHPLAREVLRRTGPMAVSSANLSGRPAAMTCDEAIEQLGDSVGVYLDAGPLEDTSGAPSTIVDFTRHSSGEVLRLGALSLAVLRETLPDLADQTENEAAAAETGSTEAGEPTQVDGAPEDAEPTEPELADVEPTEAVVSETDEADIEPAEVAETDPRPADVETTPADQAPAVANGVREPTGAHALSTEPEPEPEPEPEDSVLFEEGVAWDGDADTGTDPVMPRLVNEPDAPVPPAEPTGREQQRSVG